MKQNLRLSYIFAVIAGFLCTAAFCHKIYSKVTAVQYLTFQFDPCIAIALQKAIEKHVATFEVDGQYQVGAILDDLVRLYPEVYSFSARILPFNTAEIESLLHEPIICINHDRVLAKNRAILSAFYYADDVLNRLPQLTLTEKIPDSLSKEVVAAIQKGIKEHIFEHYVVNISSEYSWYLKDKNNSRHIICCNSDSLPLSAMQRKCSELLSSVIAKNVCKDAWIADVRFHQQIVLSRLKGGQYGKKV